MKLLRPHVRPEPAGDEAPAGPPASGESAAEPDHETRLARATQDVRVRQSRRTMPLVALGALVFVVTYWNEAPTAGLVAWVVLVLLSTAARSVVTGYISQHLDEAELPRLEVFERWLFATSCSSSLFVGSGFWLVALGGTGQAAFAVTLLCCIYAIGAMINASVSFRTFAPTVVINLGQGVVFALGVGMWEPLIAVSLIIVMLLQLGFGRFNAHQFAESIRIRTENVRLVEQLRAEKRAVEQALVAAREANDSKSQFLAAASHDLRQPLHALSLYLGGLALQLTEQQDKALLGRILETTEVLRGQFDALLDLSQFDARGVQVELADFRLEALLERLANEFGVDAEEKNLTLTVHVQPCTVRTDPVQLERLLRNLLENAVRYTRQGDISLSAHPQDGRVRLAVEDTGPGISESDQARVFQDFVQLHNRARQRHRGVGLGLAIVRRINDLLDLNLRLDSTVGQGTRFELDVPLVAESCTSAASRTRPRQSPADTAPGTSVWAVDDDPNVREALRVQLEAWGCAVIVAGSWRELQCAADLTGSPPHLALIDDMLGTEETGLDIARRLSRLMPPRRIALITGNTQPARLNELRQSGFQVLLKPTRSDQLWHLVQSCATERAL